MARIKLSKNFYLDEFTRSETAARRGVEIIVDKKTPVYHNLQRLCVKLLQPIRKQFGPVHILSGYRPKQVNKWVGGSVNSDHIRGEAADIVINGVAPYDICEWVSTHVLPFDQLIHEFGQWTHISVPTRTIATFNDPPRRQVLTAYKKNKKTRYATGLHRLDELEHDHEKIY